VAVYGFISFLQANSLTSTFQTGKNNWRKLLENTHMKWHYVLGVSGLVGLFTALYIAQLPEVSTFFRSLNYFLALLSGVLLSVAIIFFIDKHSD
jgi:NADH:ubiquinone oxidoreductase subunit 5 (subunit L)/multisubunit Na+/H+ antiporter MnhA subunit